MTRFHATGCVGLKGEPTSSSAESALTAGGSGARRARCSRRACSRASARARETTRARAGRDQPTLPRWRAKAAARQGSGAQPAAAARAAARGTRPQLTPPMPSPPPMHARERARAPRRRAMRRTWLGSQPPTTRALGCEISFVEYFLAPRVRGTLTRTRTRTLRLANEIGGGLRFSRLHVTLPARSQSSSSLSRSLFSRVARWPPRVSDGHARCEADVARAGADAQLVGAR